jgi:hypothetical protein
MSSSLTRHFLVLGAAAALIAAACSSADDPNSTTGGGGEGAGSDGGGGSPAGVGGAPSGMGGNGGKDPSTITTPEECFFEGEGGNEYVSCDYVSAAFSEPLAVADLGLEVTTDLGDSYTLESPTTGPDELALVLDLNDDETMAIGFAIVDVAEEIYTPTTVDVVVTLDNQTVADTSFSPTFSCVALTTDDWCWMGAPETITVTVP